MIDVNEETQASESQEESTEEAETSTEETSTDAALNYKEELEMARKELEKKDKRINQAEHVIEKLKKEGSEVNQENVQEMVERLVEEKIQSFSNQVRGDAIDNLISSYASNEDEAALIKHHLENSIKPSGDDVVDIINAKALANKARFTQQTAEIRRAQSASEAEKATSSGQKESQKTKRRLSQQDRKIMQMYGVSEEDLEKGVRN